MDEGVAAIDPNTPNIARVYNFLLGGKDNYAADRAYAAELLTLLPDAELLARANRHFLTRAVHFLAGEGIEQFIDIGAGLPAVDNVHEVAQRTNPDARVVYVDKDPIVVAHGRALLDSGCLTAVITADMVDPAAIIGHPDTKRLIDFTRPIAVIFASVLHFVAGGEAGQLTGFWAQAVAAGSPLVISHAEDRPELAPAAELYQQELKTGTLRSREEIADLFAGFELVDPGLVPLPLWRPETSILAEGSEAMPMLAGVGRRTGPGLETAS